MEVLPMQETTTVKQIFRESDPFIGKQITVSGWIRTLRDSKNFGFIELNDGTFFKNLQIVFDNTLDNFAEIGKLNIGSALIVQGELVESPGAKQPFELKATEVTVEGAADSDYPLQKKRHS